MAVFPSRDVRLFGLRPREKASAQSDPFAAASTPAAAPKATEPLFTQPAAKPAQPAAAPAAAAPPAVTPIPTPSATKATPTASPVQRYLGSDFRSLGLAPKAADAPTTNPLARDPRSNVSGMPGGYRPDPNAGGPVTGNPELDALYHTNRVLWAYLQSGVNSPAVAPPPETVPQVNPLARGEPAPAPSPTGQRFKVAGDAASAPPPVAAAPAVAPNVAPPVMAPPIVSQAPPPVAAPVVAELPPIFKEDPLAPTRAPYKGPTDRAGLDASKKDTVWVLPEGEVVGYGGKLEHDVGDIYKKELGRSADAGGMAYWRARLASGEDPEALSKEFDASAEGQEWNLMVDPLDDAGFVKRAYRTILGRDPDKDGAAWLTNMLAQGYDRAAAIELLQKSPEYAAAARKVDQATIDKLIGQGDSFKEELKDDETEKSIRALFKAEIGRDPTARELAKYADLVRTGKLKSETTDPTTGDQIARAFYRTLFGEQYNPSAEEIATVSNTLANSPAGSSDTVLRQLAAQRRLGDDYRTSGRAVSDDQILAAISALRNQNIQGPLLEMLRARKVAGFADGGRVKKEGKLSDINTEKVTQRPGTKTVRTPPGSIGVRGRKDEPDIEMEELNRGGRVIRPASRGLPRRAPVTIDQMPVRLADGGRVSGLSYQAYLERVKPWIGSDLGFSESSQRFEPISEANWNAMTDQQRFQNMPTADGSGPQSGGGWQAADEDAVAAFRARFSDSLNNNVEQNNVRQDSSLIYGFGDPMLYGQGAENWAADPSRIVRLPDGRWVMERNNIRGDKLAEFQSRDDDSGMGDGTNFAILAASVMGAGYLAGQAGWLGAEGAAGDALASAPGQGFGTSGPGVGVPTTPAPAGGLPVDVPADIPTGTSTYGGGTPLDGMPDIYTAGNTPIPQLDLSQMQALMQDPQLMMNLPPPIQSAVMGQAPGWQQQLMAWARANPSAVARLGLSASSLLGGQQGSPGAPGSYRPGDGTGTDGGYRPGDGGTMPPPGGTTTPPPPPPAPGANPLAGSPVINKPAAAAPAPAPAPASTPSTVYVGGGGTSSVGGGSTMMGKTGADASDPINDLLGLGQEQIERYRRFDPLERQVISEAGRAGDAASQEEQAALAGETVAGQFDRSRGMVRRRAGVDPARAAALTAQIDVGEGGAKAYAMNDARRAERDGGFTKRMAALGLGDSALKTGLGAVSGGISALLNKEQMQNSRDATAQSTSVSMSQIGARMAEAAAAREMEAQRLREQQRQYDTSFNEGSRRYEQDFGENRRRSDRGYDRGVYESDRGYTRGAFSDDRSFDYRVWADRNNITRQNEQDEYTRNRNRWADIGSGVRTGLDAWNTASSYFGWADGGRVRLKGMPARTGYASGGRAAMRDFASGGEVAGTPHPDPGVDTVPAMLRPDEFVLNAEGTRYLDKVAPGFLEAANERGLAIRAGRDPRVRGLSRRRTA